MTFTEEVKQEILSETFSACCREAMLSAFIRTSGALRYKDGLMGFEITTESERSAEYFYALISSLYGEDALLTEAKRDLKSGRDKLTFECFSDTSRNILLSLGIVYGTSGLNVNLGISDYLIENECCKKAYILGAFVGGGSVSHSSGYHLEFIFSRHEIADDFSALLAHFDFLPKIIERKDTFVVYFKSSEEITDLLVFMGASRSALKMTELVVNKDYNNNVNRKINCDMANIKKQVDASMRQVELIEDIDRTVSLSSLAPTLSSVARARLDNPDDTMQELADRLNITKSCLNHRMRKLEEIRRNL